MSNFYFQMVILSEIIENRSIKQRFFIFFNIGQKIFFVYKWLYKRNGGDYEMEVGLVGLGKIGI